MEIRKNSSILEGLQPNDDLDDTSLHVHNSRALDGIGINFLEPLKGAGAFENGIEMADQEYGLGGIVALVFGVEMTSTIHTLQGNPPSFKSQVLQFPFEDLRGFSDAGEVHGSAVDVDGFLDQLQAIRHEMIIHICLDSGLYLRKLGCQSGIRKKPKRKHHILVAANFLALNQQT